MSATNNHLPEKIFRRCSITTSMTSTQSPSSASSCASSEDFTDFAADCELDDLNESDHTGTVCAFEDTRGGISIASDNDDGDDDQSESERCTSSACSSDWSGSDDEGEFEELMAELPIALGQVQATMPNIAATTIPQIPAPAPTQLSSNIALKGQETQPDITAPVKPITPTPAHVRPSNSIAPSSIADVTDFIEDCEEIDDFDENDASFNVAYASSDDDTRGGSSIASDDGEDENDNSESESDRVSSGCSSDWSGSDDEDEFDELMAELPIALGRSRVQASIPKIAAPTIRQAPAPAPVHPSGKIVPIPLDRVEGQATKPEIAAIVKPITPTPAPVQPSNSIAPLMEHASSIADVTDFIEDCEEIDDFDENDAAFHVAYASSDNGCSIASGDGDDDESNDSQSESERCTSSACSSDWSGSDDEGEFEELMAELPIALGRSKDQATMLKIAASKIPQTPAPVQAPVEVSAPSKEDSPSVGGTAPTLRNSAGSSFVSSTCSSACSSSDWSGSDSEDGEEYADLMASLPKLPLPANLARRPQSVSSGGSCTSSCSVVSSNGTCDSSSEYDSEYDELMAEMPVALGRKDPASQTRVATMIKAPAATAPPVTKKSYPVPPPELMNPMEGLAMFQSIRADLEKVGRLIVAKKEGEKFLQRAHILASINWLAVSVPTCVLDHLGQEIRRSLDEEKKAKEQEGCVDCVEIADDASEASALSDTGVSDSDDDDEIVEFDDRSVSSPKNKQHMKACRRVSYLSTVHVGEKDEKGSELPYVSYFRGALLFVDISGFTQLSTMMDPENLSKVINQYFQQLVDKIFAFGGDVQKYAGDAIFAEWRASSTTTLEECVAAAAACSVSMVKNCANFPVLALTGKLVAVSPAPTLNVHLGLGVGRLAGFHVGDNTHRREYLYLGDPIMQATEACNKAQIGEAVASPQFREVLARLGLTEAASGESLIIANRDIVNVNMLKRRSEIRPRNAKTRGITDHVDGLHVDALIEYRRLMSLYVHPVMVSNDVAAFNNFKSSTRSGTDQERRREDAELRSVYIMFINPLVDLRLTGDAENDREYVVLVNDIMNLVTRELNHHTGHLRQCIVDDKGLVLITTFGLRGSTFPNMVTERALPATFAISRALQIELGVKSKIGATFGDVYCGAVGGELRHEYAVMGPSCNLAARLMCSPTNPGILVDNAVRKIAARSYCFNALDPVKAKGYTEPVPIFEPLGPIVHSWGRIEANFVGRRDEILKLTNIANDMMLSDYAAPRIVIISSPSGMGKSTLLAHSIEHIRRVIGARRGMAIVKHAGRECDLLVPFSTIRAILFNLMVSFKTSADDQSHASGLHSAYSGACSLGYDSISAASAAELSTMTETQTLVALEQVCYELKPPESMVDYVKFHLLGIEINSSRRESIKVPSMRSIAAFIARIFVRCCEECSFVLVALDDIHRADEMSWQVLQQVFETADNVLIVGTAHSATDLSLRIDKNFWTMLNENYLRKGRLVKMEIDRLTEDEIVSMTMKTLGLHRKDVQGSDILNEVLVQSGGTPHFANKILEGIKQRLVSSLPQSGETDNSIAEIVLHRVDSFDVGVRSTLNVGAVLGLSFSLGEVVSVLKESNDAKEADLRRQTIESLQFLVNEGILFAGEKQLGSVLKQTSILNGDSTTFTFYHDVWRSTVLRLMLGSRKRDVHKKIAQSMESAVNNKVAPADYMKKVFVHWQGAGDASMMASTALAIGKSLEHDPEQLSETIQLYDETLKMWGLFTTRDQVIGGFPPELLSLISSTDLSKIISLMVSQGRSLALHGQHKESVAAYDNALRIKEGAAAYSLIKDCSVIFPAYTGICDAVSSGHVQQDVDRSYEQNMIHQFLEATRSYGRLVHHIHALYLQMDLFGQLGDIDKALAVHSIIKRAYKPEKHSTGLRNVYGKDSGALSFARCSYLEMAQGNSRQAMRSCRYFLKEIYPKIETDLAQSFSMIYPLVLVLKDGGYSPEAKRLFEKAVVEPFEGDCQSESMLISVYKPLSMMLTLSDKAKVSEDTLLECLAWASDPGNVCLGAQVNLHLGRLGRCGDSISAEICALLAVKIRKGSDRDSLVALGTRLVAEQTDFLRKHRLKSAAMQLHQVQSKLEALRRRETHDKVYRYGGGSLANRVEI